MALQLFDDLQNDHGEQAVGLSLHVWQVAEMQGGGGLSVFICKEVEGLHLLLRHRLDGAANLQREGRHAVGLREGVEPSRCHAARLHHADQLDEMVSNWTRSQRRDDIVRILIEAGVPCAPVREMEEVIQDPEVAQRGTLVDSTYPGRGEIRVAGSPVKLSAIAPEEVPNRRPPELGEHTEEILSSIGISRERIRQLREESAI